MRLRTLLFDCPKPILDALEACNIDTDEEFLFSSSAIALFQKLPPNIITYAELENLRDRVARSLAAEGRSGEEDLQELDGVDDKEGTHWKAGVSALDHLLQTVGHGIIEVAGGRGSGKTGLVLALALNCLLESPDNVVHWIDTAGEFSAERASMLENQLLTDNVHHYAPVDSALQRLHVSMAFTADECYNVLQVIRSQARTETNRRTRLVVIDPITPLFGPHLSTISSEGHAIMTAFMKEVRSLAVDNSLLVLASEGHKLVTAYFVLPSNPTSAFTSTKLKPALGPTFSFLTDATLWISSCQDVLNVSAQTESKPFIAELIRSRVTMDRNWWTFDMADTLREIAQTEME